MTLAAGAALAAFVLGLAAMKLLMGALERAQMRQVVREDGPQSHLKKSKTLTMGGIGFAVSLTATAILFGGFRSPAVLAILASALLCGLMGFLDDFKKFRGQKTEGLKARYKLLIQTALAAGLGWLFAGPLAVGSHGSLAAGSLVLPFGLGAFSAGWLFYPLVVVVFLGTVNAVNFTDGLDGLLSGALVPTALAFAAFFYAKGEARFFILIAALIGSLGAFLCFNCHPAKIFMGDTGSMFLGGLLAALAIASGTVFFLAIAGGLYVWEAVSVIIQVISFKTTGKRPFKMAPFHHHLELAGWPEPAVVVRLWVASGICSAAAIAAFLWGA